MSVSAYTLKLELIGSQDPAITRTFTVPASWTFRKLHSAIQYTFGWQNCHLHSFTFEPADGSELGSNDDGQFAFDDGKPLLEIHMGADEDEFGFGDGINAGIARIQENEIRLCDVYEEGGSYRKKVVKGGKLGDCIYLYDFGDNWELMVTLISSTTLDSNVLKVIEVQGASPLEDSGGIWGWDALKRAFAAARPDKEQKHTIHWAREMAGNTYDPTVAPTVDEFNARGGFDAWLEIAGEDSDVDDDE
ncbi:hypothetical protein ID866_7488 [Astraeus odoratus]|nr:hypothetical protein ID866_7488 [Astraeus odoratus]